jgi:hypothetical protein
MACLQLDLQSLYGLVNTMKTHGDDNQVACRLWNPCLASVCHAPDLCMYSLARVSRK